MLKILIEFCFLLSLFSNFRSTEQNSGPVIKTPQGDVQGTWLTTINERKIEAFMGMPYAKPPVGPLRFKSPEPYGSWTSIHDGTKNPSVCPQLGMYTGSSEPVIGNEDCLYLNVYTPHASDNSKYPVMVFIHGGGFTSGSCISSMYGPDMILDKDVVLVVPNYRLGLLGFLSTEDEVLPGNLGLKDQNLALKWVQENIAAYGGNPDNVTIFGQSAGGASVHFQMLSPRSKGLFQRAIPMSGSAFCPWAMSVPGRVKNFTKKFGERLKCSTSSSTELLDCLSKVEVTSLVLNAADLSEWYPLVIFTPVLERESERSFITAESYKTHTSVPMMTGATSDEGLLMLDAFKSLPLPLNYDIMLSHMNQNFEQIGPVTLQMEDKFDNPSEMAKQIRRGFFGIKDISNDTVAELVYMYSDVLFFEPIKVSIRRHNGTAFLYLFAFNGQFSLSHKVTAGRFDNAVAHSDDIQYLFPVEHFIRNTTFNEEEKKISQEFVDYIVNFAKHGNPTPDGKPVKWDATSTDKLNYLLIDNDVTKMQNGFLIDKENLWRNVNPLNKLIPKGE